MKTMAALAALIVAASVMSSSRAAAQTPHDMSAEDHMKMMQHGASTMGFSQTDTTHHFLLKKDGGVIQVEANSAQDTGNRDLIRTHLAKIAQAFKAGDFSDPMSVHDQIPTGVPVLQRFKAEIRYRFEETPQGGRVQISTGNKQALAAIDEFLRFQVMEHQTGDPLRVR